MSVARKAVITVVVVLLLAAVKQGAEAAGMRCRIEPGPRGMLKLVADA